MKIEFTREGIRFPEKNKEEMIEIPIQGTIAYDQMKCDEAMEYFRKKLQVESGIPNINLGEDKE